MGFPSIQLPKLPNPAANPLPYGTPTAAVSPNSAAEVAPAGLFGGGLPTPVNAADRKGTNVSQTANSLQNPGMGENIAAQTMPWFLSPTQGQQSFGDLSKFFQQQMGQSGPTFAADAYSQYNPSVSANLDPYYNDAWDRTSGRINREFGARGGYNSSAATGQLSDAARGLGADQAKAEAQYGLDRARLGGTLASAASGEALGGRGLQLGAGGALGNLAQGVDQGSLSRMLGGVSTAFNGQDAQEGRIRGVFQDLLGYGGATSGVLNQGYDSLLNNDATLFGMPWELIMAALNSKQNAETQRSGNILEAGSSATEAAL